MFTYTKTLHTVEEYAMVFGRSRGQTFQSKKLRDAVARLVAKRGIIATKGVRHNQNMHPEYVDDYEGEIETGFGNTMYDTFFKALYTLS